MTKPSKRLHTRYDCHIPTQVLAVPYNSTCKGELINIGLGGALLKLTEKGRAGVEARLTFTYLGESYILDAYVIREVQADPKNPKEKHFALEFHPYPETLRHLNALLESLGRSSDASAK